MDGVVSTSQPGLFSPPAPLGVKSLTAVEARTLLSPAYSVSASPALFSLHHARDGRTDAGGRSLSLCEASTQTVRLASLLAPRGKHFKVEGRG